MLEIGRGGFFHFPRTVFQNWSTARCRTDDQVKILDPLIGESQECTRVLQTGSKIMPDITVITSKFCTPRII